MLKSSKRYYNSVEATKIIFIITKSVVRDHRDRDRMVVGITTTCPISAYHHKSCEFEPRSW
jgi:hypothetical protein